MEKQNAGIIMKGIGGFYYVEASNTIYECRARGIFRKSKIIPNVGDRVVITIPENGMPVVDSIAERKNTLIRPPVSNIDQLLIIVSVAEPNPNMLVIDKLIAIAENKNIVPAIIINKTDLMPCDWLFDIYHSVGIGVVKVSAETGEGIAQVKEMLTGKISAFTGNSGVGKSSILNKIDNRLGLATGEISRKLGRGRHTTRHVELFKVQDGYIADTPGFSSLDLEKCELVQKHDLQFCFREFSPYLGKCQFSSCTHINAKGCKICEAVDEGIITESRYNNYVTLYNEVKDIKEWELS